MAEPGARSVRIERHRAGHEPRIEDDWVADEAPLDLYLGGVPLAVILRTPTAVDGVSDDRALALGFLFSEGIIQGREDVARCERSTDPAAYDPDNRLEIELTPAAARAQRERIEHSRREIASIGGCGLCGKRRIEELFQRLPVRSAEAEPLDAELVQSLPGKMRRYQPLFDRTGGLHAAALFGLDGELVDPALDVAEDVGRHNAVDKVLGRALDGGLLGGRRLLGDRILVVSARAGFEIVQKAALAGVRGLVAVGAASGLAVEVAGRGGLEVWWFVGVGRGVRLTSEKVSPGEFFFVG